MSELKPRLDLAKKSSLVHLNGGRRLTYTPNASFFLIVFFPLLMFLVGIRVPKYGNTSFFYHHRALGDLLLIIPLFALTAMIIATRKIKTYWLQRDKFAVWLPPLIALVYVLGMLASLFIILLGIVMVS